jgi:hypothetical protein
MLQRVGRAKLGGSIVAGGQTTSPLKERVRKRRRGRTLTGVRIPLSPPLIFSGEKVLQKQALLEPVYLHGGAPVSDLLPRFGGSLD